MPTATAILYKRYKSKDDTYPVVIRLIDGRAQRFFNTGYKLEEKYWSGEAKKHEDAALINEAIAGYLSQAKTYFADCRRSGKPVNLDLAFASVKSYSFLEYLQHRERQHTEAGQIEMEYKVRRFLKELAGCFGLAGHFAYFYSIFKILREIFGLIREVALYLQYTKKQYEYMQLTQKTLQAIKDKRIRRRLAEALDVTDQAIVKYIKGNSDNLTKAAALLVIKEETGITDNQLFETAA